MQVTQLMPTHFAPAERASERQLRDETALLASSPITQLLLETVPKAILVLNRHRQIVAANDTFRNLLGLQCLDTVIGLRPGEALGCVHATREDGGCGTSDACVRCSAGQAIVASLRGERESRDCRIPLVNGHGALDLCISVTPLEVDDRFFTVLVAAPA